MRISVSVTQFSRAFARKPIRELEVEARAQSRRLKRALGAVDLVALGVGAIVGAGIFLTVGTAAAGEGTVRPGAGPAIVLSFLLTGLACGFSALCYAEMAAMIPIAGSAYTYAYATLGEIFGWIIGWDLLIEYAAGNVAVAISWSGYFQELVAGGATLALGRPLRLPPWLAHGLRHAPREALASAPRLGGVPLVVNLPAAAIVLLLTWILVIGVKRSSRLNLWLVATKLVVLVFFIAIGIHFFDLSNWFRPGASSAWRSFAPNGWHGIATGAAIVFFAYIGFDAVSTAAEETRNPPHDLPIGILGSLGICTVLYVAVAVVLTGMVPWRELGTAEPLATALSAKGLTWASTLVAFGSVVAHTAVLLVFQLGQPRIFFAMAHDGLLPAWCAAVHPQYGTPHVTTILTGAVVAVFAGFFPVDEIVDLTNIGTLFAFVLVAFGVLILRVAEPNRPRHFHAPLVWITAPLAIVTCLFLMAYLPLATWIRFAVWLVIGLALYFARLLQPALA
jgi:basic amino acid/polyamine antiporter, APA family